MLFADVNDWLPYATALLASAATWLTTELRHFLKDRRARQDTLTGQRKLDLEGLLQKVEQKWEESEKRVANLEAGADLLRERMGELEIDFHLSVAHGRGLEDILDEKQIRHRKWDDVYRVHLSARPRRPHRPAAPQEPS